ncbi:casein kinase substrate phosphoprotein PP28-domain-containing protein [Trichophaea hybrida]|nr:casein kinase substrate phosphoprotein PP28-domain-containing protein [Trichophaea hybrida]
MAPGAPRGKRKVTRGGGKHFSRNLKPLEDEETSVPQDTWTEPREKPASDDESEEESSAEEEDTQATLSREERKAAAKAKKEAAKARAQTATAAVSGSDDEDEDDDKEAPALAPRKQTHGHAGIKVSNPNDAANSATGGLSRREREAVEAAAAKERFWKLQEAGKTDQARADMARLAIIRQEREEKARQRKAELEEKKALAEAKADSRGKRR